MSEKKVVPLWKLLAPVVVAVIVWLIGAPTGLGAGAWLYVSIFAGLVVGLILEPMPPAFVGLIAIIVSILFRVGPAVKIDALTGNAFPITSAAAISWGLSGFSNTIVWLIFAAFMIGIGYQNSGLGRRIALFLVQKLGTSSLGLGYAIALTDLILAPFIPSNAARSGGTIYPVVSSICPMFDSYPDKNPRKIGSYLTWVSLATTCVSSSIFLTGQAPNPLAVELAAKSGVVTMSWTSWFLALLPVSIILFIITPLLAYILCKPEVKGSSEIAKWARTEFRTLGTMSFGEIAMACISVLALVLWIGSSYFGINPTTTALIVIILMVLTKIITWQDFLANKPAWNVLTWFATLVPMASGLKNVGFLNWLAHMAGGTLVSLDPTIAMLGLLIAFCVLRYFFASATAYVTAMVGLFVALVLEIPGVNATEVMTILLLPMGIMGVLTPYGTGHSPVWFASGFIKGPEFWKLGFIFGFIYLAIFIIVGIPWIRFILPYIG
ncbi:DASS family sodium-coupled anion symporter [Veillonella montpellierensis]|uniref:DASS family sodium-coupled anion symporter n=1 Tax=Veillonella montpellierensis TaxID=187328 RepID=UPI0023F7E62E|nr:DASS family sodium-coupled anion symporter [Veillonella montpellierensis]